jgi:microcystin-dependent protein
MADTITDNYGFIKPEISGSNSTWGNKLNSGLDSIDTELAARDALLVGTENSLADDDIFKFVDVSDSNIRKRTTWGNIKELIQQLHSLANPPGIMSPYAGLEAPDGWLLCHGQAVSRTTFAALFDKIGIAWGAGNGATTFNVPDMRGRTFAGIDNIGGTAANRLTSEGFGQTATVVGRTGGNQMHQLTIAQMPQHNHGGNTGNAGAHNHEVGGNNRAQGFAGGAAISAGDAAGNATSSSAPNHNHSIPDQGNSDAHPNVQPTAVGNWIIKT